MGWLLPIGVLANLIYSVLRTDPRDWGVLLDFSIPFLIIAFLLSLVPWLLNAVRVWNWLRFFGKTDSYLNCVQIVLGAEMAASVSPTAVGGGPVKMAMLIHRGISAGRALTIMSLGTLEDASCNILLIPLFLLLTGTWRLLLHRELIEALVKYLPLILGLLVLVTMLLYGLGRFFRRRRLVRICHVRRRKVLREFRASWRVIGQRGGPAFLINALIASVQWCLRYFIFAALAAGMGATVDPLLFAALQWLCLTLMTFLPTPGAAGGAEAIFIWLHAGVLPESSVELMMFGWRFLTFYLFNALAILGYLVISHYHRSAPTDRDRRTLP